MAYDNNPNYANYDISQDRYISRATRNPPSHFDWETWRKIGQPGQYPFPPGHTTTWTPVRTGAGEPNYGPSKSHYNMFDATGEALGRFAAGATGFAQALQKRRQGKTANMSGTPSSSAGNGASMAGSGRSQNLSITGDSGSRTMRRGRGSGTTFADMSSNLGIQMVQGSDVYGDNYGQVMGGVVGDVNAPFQSGNVGGTFSTGPNRNVSSTQTPPQQPAGGFGFPPPSTTPPPPPPTNNWPAPTPTAPPSPPKTSGAPVAGPAPTPGLPRTPFTPVPGVTPSFPAPGLTPFSQSPSGPAPVGPQTPIEGPAMKPFKSQDTYMGIPTGSAGTLTPRAAKKYKGDQSGALPQFARMAQSSFITGSPTATVPSAGITKAKRGKK